MNLKKTERNRWMSLILMFALTICLASGFSFPSAAADSEIVILHTNDVHCSVEDVYKRQALILTIISLVDYIAKNHKVLTEGKM